MKNHYILKKKVSDNMEKTLEQLYYEYINICKKLPNISLKKQSKKFSKTMKLINEWYIDDCALKFLKTSKNIAIKNIKEMLSSKEGTEELMSLLERIFCDDQDYINQLEDLDYITKDIINRIQFKEIIKRKYEIDEVFWKYDYFNIYLKYNELYNKLIAHYEQFN